MKKRGQLTLFLVLGIILVILVFVMVYYRAAITDTVSKKVLNKAVVLPSNVKNVQSYVQSCVEDNSLSSLYYLGGQGGLSSPTPNNAFVSDDFHAAYGYYNGKNTLPSLADFERDFSASMNSFLPTCLASADFNKLKISPSKPSTNLEFFDDKVKVSVDYPLAVSEGESVYNLNDPYEVEYPLRVKLLHDIGGSIVKKSASDPTNIDVSYLLDLGVRVDVYPYDEKTVIYALSDIKSVINNASYYYVFAVRPVQ